MKFTLFFGLVFLTAAVCGAQVIIKEPSSQLPTDTVAKLETSNENSLPFDAKKEPKQQTQQDDTQAAYVRPSANKRFKSYVNGMFGPVAVGKNLATAGISTWRNSPEEWGDKWEGFGRRFASNMGKGIVKQTVSYGLEEAFKLDSKYYRSKKKDVGSRVKNALLSTVTARDQNGKRVFGFPKIAGTYAASITAAEMWYPSRFDYKDGLRSGTISLGFSAAFNLVKEFVWKK